jgi:hypothetical protein
MSKPPADRSGVEILKEESRARRGTLFEEFASPWLGSDRTRAEVRTVEYEPGVPLRAPRDGVPA